VIVIVTVTVTVTVTTTIVEETGIETRETEIVRGRETVEKIDIVAKTIENAETETEGNKNEQPELHGNAAISYYTLRKHQYSRLLHERSCTRRLEHKLPQKRRWRLPKIQNGQSDE